MVYLNHVLDHENIFETQIDSTNKNILLALYLCQSLNKAEYFVL